MTDKDKSTEVERAVKLFEPPRKSSWWHRVRANFLTGVVVFAPISITVYLLWTFVDFVDARVLPLVPAVYNPETYLPFSLPGLGVVFFFVFVAGLGALARNLFGRQLFRIGENFVDRMPVIRSVYTALKQIVETIFARSGEDSFEQVCLVEYPRPGLWAVAFVTTDTSGEISARAENDMISILQGCDDAGYERRRCSETRYFSRARHTPMAGVGP